MHGCVAALVLLGVVVPSAGAEGAEGDVAVTPVAPSQVDNAVLVPDVEGVAYRQVHADVIVSGDLSLSRERHTLENPLVICAEALDGYRLTDPTPRARENCWTFPWLSGTTSTVRPATPSAHPEDRFFTEVDGSVSCLIRFPFDPRGVRERDEPMKALTQGLDRDDRLLRLHTTATVWKGPHAGFAFPGVQTRRWTFRCTPAGPVATTYFRDVRPGDRFFPEISWLSEGGVSTGWQRQDGSRDYRPGAPVARDAMAAFLYRYADDVLGADTAAVRPPARTPFPDVAASNRFYREISWLHGSEVSTDWGAPPNAQFRPISAVNRDAMAAFMSRLDRLR